MGMVRPDSAQDRIMRSIESASVRQAAAVTTLTAAAITELSSRHDGFDPRAATVVPTCVDLDRFSAAGLPPASPVVVLLSGSLNGLYDVPTTLCLIERLRAHSAVVIRHLRPASAPADAALDSLRASGTSIASVAFADMPGEIRSAHVGLSICHADLGAAISGAAPTKVAEFLACGRPVVVNAGLGDFDDLLTHHRAGVVLRGTSEDELDRGAVELLNLLADPATPARCRALAEKCFDVDDAVDRLLAVYRRASERLC
jgi:glycosyltransferase involved in cell wall biosynthesis